MSMADSHNPMADSFERADVVLQVADLRAGYGRVPVLHGVNLQIHEGEAVGIVAFCVCVSVFGDKESRLRRKKTKTLARASTSPLSPIFLSSSSPLSLAAL